MGGGGVECWMFSKVEYCNNMQLYVSVFFFPDTYIPSALIWTNTRGLELEMRELLH